MFYVCSRLAVKQWPHSDHHLLKWLLRGSTDIPPIPHVHSIMLIVLDIDLVKVGVA